MDADNREIPHSKMIFAPIVAIFIFRYAHQCNHRNKESIK